MFCGEAIGPEDESLRLSLEAEWTDGSAVYWCHGPCLEEATHPSVPLYVLSLRRDEAVFGRRVDRDQEHLSLMADCIRRELQTASAIHDLGLRSEALDQLADGVLDGIDQGFTFAWRPRWVPQGEPHVWAEGGRSFARCNDCLEVSLAADDDRAARTWFQHHRCSHRQG